eukprot:TRINITY_DN57626_c0_g1_i1.p1 TRINITY_DN57626_c0_g1~~TRINITY_DN57626_c0_g1_i1.p1  ORF type:complete len:624 (+),score=59.66 TRINITY_DN57626_c0_g1_i1:91-1962(+)
MAFGIISNREIRFDDVMQKLSAAKSNISGSTTENCDRRGYRNDDPAPTSAAMLISCGCADATSVSLPKLPDGIDLQCDSIKGRVLVAQKSLSVGDEVLREAPLLFAMADSRLGHEVLKGFCLRCARPRPKLLEGFASSCLCGHGFCCKECSEIHADIHRYECRLLRRGLPGLHAESGGWRDGLTSDHCSSAGKKVNEYRLAQSESRVWTYTQFVLRAASLKFARRTEWDRLMQLEAHTQTRAQRYPQKSNTLRSLAARLSAILTDEEVPLSVEDTVRVLDIVAVNGVRLQLSPEASLIGVYATFSLLEHSCVSTCLYYPAVEGDDGIGASPNGSIHGCPAEIVLRSRSTLKPGMPLSISYVPVDQPLFLRQRNLRGDKCFRCGCDRCRDPTECGSDLAALRCGCGGLLKPPITNADYDLAVAGVEPEEGTPREGSSDFSCAICGVTLPVEVAFRMTEEAASVWLEAASAAAIGGSEAAESLERLRRRCGRQRGSAVFVAYLCDVELALTIAKHYDGSRLAVCPEGEARAAEAAGLRALEVAKQVLPDYDAQLMRIQSGIAKARLVLLRFCRPAERSNAFRETFRTLLLAADQARVCFGRSSRKHRELSELAAELRQAIARHCG